MKKYKNALISFGFLLAAPVWIFLWTQFGKNLLLNSPPNLINATYVIPYFLFIILGIFFGWKNLKAKQSLILGNIITLIGMGMLFFSAFLYLVSVSL
jgi:hypothetical protein